MFVQFLISEQGDATCYLLKKVFHMCVYITSKMMKTLFCKLLKGLHWENVKKSIVNSIDKIP